MAQRRMLSLRVIDSDEFLAMPLGVQALYFHLAVGADDHGIIRNARSISRGIDADETWITMLVERGFLHVIEAGYEIAHWAIHNALQETQNARRTYEYTVFRRNVLNRDKHKCQMCGAGVLLAVHHIKSFSANESLRTDIENGITLCKLCHIAVHKGEANERGR